MPVGRGDSVFEVIGLRFAPRYWGVLLVEAVAIRLAGIQEFAWAGLGGGVELIDEARPRIDPLLVHREEFLDFFVGRWKGFAHRWVVGLLCMRSVFEQSFEADRRVSA